MVRIGIRRRRLGGGSSEKRKKDRCSLLLPAVTNEVRGTEMHFVDHQRLVEQVEPEIHIFPSAIKPSTDSCVEAFCEAYTGSLREN